MSNPKPNDDKRNYEDPEEVNPSEDSEEYIPYGYDWEHNNAADIAHDAQEPKEGITEEEEITSAPTPLPQPTHHYCQRGKESMKRQIARRSPGPVTAKYLFGYDPIIGWETTGHYELGGSSQAPPTPGRFLPPVAPTPPPLVIPVPNRGIPFDAPTLEEHNQLLHEVEGIQEHRVMDSAAIQTLYCRVGAGRTHTVTNDAHIHAHEYRLEVAEREIRALERECLQLREELAKLTRYVRRRKD